MKITHLYVMKDILTYFLIAVLIFGVVFMMGKTLQLTDLLVNKGVSLFDIGKLLIYFLPSALIFMIPIALLSGVLITFARLSSDNEIVAFKASGVSLYQLTPPVLFLSVMAYLLTTFLVIYALPWGNQGFKHVLYDIAKTKAYTALKERTFNDSFDGIVIYVDKTPLRGKRLERVFIHSEGKQEAWGESKTILANEGYVITNPNSQEIIFHLIGVTGDQMSQGGQSYARIESDALVQKLTFEGNLSRIRGFRARDWEMSIGELRTKIKIKKMLHQDYTDQLLEIYRKFSIPFACIAFGLMGIPLGIQPRRSGKSYGFILGILVVMGYYILLTSAETLASNRTLPPLIASWTPNFVLIAISIYLLVKTANESPIQILQWLGEIMDSITLKIKKFSRTI
jgi:lipopolysaccharide export system permease protein